MDDIEAKAVLAFASQAARELRRLDAGIWRERLEARYIPPGKGQMTG